jgi:hypothetical protein
MKRLVLILLLFATAASAQTVVTQVGAIYATGSKLLQRIYIPSASNAEIAQQFVATGESLLIVPITTFRTGGVAAVQAAVGTPTFSGRSVVIDQTNTVTATIIADPALYSDPRGVVTPHDLAQVGDTWTGTKFVRRYVEINPHAPNATSAIVTVSIQSIANPTPVTPGDIMMQSNTLNVGMAIPAALFLKLQGFP